MKSNMDETSQNVHKTAKLKSPMEDESKPKDKD